MGAVTKIFSDFS